MNNLETWNKMNRPPTSALKTIRAGRLKGKSDINPQWRIKIMTETFGMIGFGWYYEIVDKWIEDANAPEKTANVEIKLYVKQNDEWSKPIQGMGGAMYIANERNGIHSNDEAFKMALTDALSVAMKELGVAADIYMGLWDGSKYLETPTQPEFKPKIENTVKLITDDLKYMVNQSVPGFETKQAVKSYIKKELGVDKLSDCTDNKKLEKFHDKISAKTMQNDLELEMASKLYFDANQRTQFATNILNMPLTECYDMKKLELLKKEIIKESKK